MIFHFSSNVVCLQLGSLIEAAHKLWRVHRDESSGTLRFFNTVTQEKTAKCPEFFVINHADKVTALLHCVFFSVVLFCGWAPDCIDSVQPDSNGRRSEKGNEMS